MAFVRRCFILIAPILFVELATTHFAWNQAASSVSNQIAKERARVVLAKTLPKLDSSHLKVTLVEVNYGPGEASAPHSHPCAVFAYVAARILRSQVKGEPERIYKAGESFYEAPNGIHLASANASTTEPARLVAYLICDHDAPLSEDLPQTHHQDGPAQ